MGNNIIRPHLIAMVADNLDLRLADDVPAIRQAINDTADSYRKNGWTVRDFEQNAMVRAVQRRMKERA